MVLAKDKVPALRAAAIAALGRLEDTKAVDTAIAALQDEEQSVRIQAALACGYLHANDATEPLLHMIEDKDKSIRMAVIQALGGINTKQVVPTLLTIIKNSDETNVMRLAASEALCHNTTNDGVEAIASVALECTWPMKTPAAMALGRLKDPRALDPLLRVVRNRALGTATQSEAIQLLVTLGDEKAIPPLVALRNEPLIGAQAAYAAAQIRVNKPR